MIQHEPLGFHDYNCLQMNAFCVVSDSGTLPEESSFFTSVGHPFPAVCIRTSTERPEALDKGDFILAGIDGDHLLQAVDVAVEMNRNRDLGIPVPDYVDENVSDKVVKIIQSYTGVRHEGFIPWDDDIDIQMPRPDYDRFVELFNKREHQDNILAVAPTDEIARHTFIKVCDFDTRKIEEGILYKNEKYLGIDIDVFPIYGLQESD